MCRDIDKTTNIDLRADWLRAIALPMQPKANRGQARLDHPIENSLRFESFQLVLLDSPSGSLNMSDTCGRADNVFSPTIRGSRDGTDFTLLFEKFFLLLLPAVCFLASSVYRYFELAKKKSVLKTSLDWLILEKIVGNSSRGFITQKDS